MGYRGKVVEQQRARALRAQAWTLADIAAELGVSKSSVSLWVRDVAFEPQPRRMARRRGPNRLQLAKHAEIERLRAEGVNDIGALSDRDLLIAGTALYAGEGSKTDGVVKFANSDPRMVVLFCAWFRRIVVVDESRLRCRLHLHEGLDLRQPPASGRSARASPWHSSPSHTERRPMPPSVTTSMCSAASRWCTAVPGPTEPSWGSSTRCYPAGSLPG
jgi:hypothetical protein